MAENLTFPCSIRRFWLPACALLMLGWACGAWIAVLNLSPAPSIPERLRAARVAPTADQAVKPHQIPRLSAARAPDKPAPACPSPALEPTLPGQPGVDDDPSGVMLPVERRWSSFAPAVAVALQSHKLDWHDAVPAVEPLPPAEQAALRALTGNSRAWTGSPGPLDKLPACPVLRDKCLIHSTVSGCIADELCGWCGSRSLCVSHTALQPSLPNQARGSEVPVCPEGVWVSVESAAHAARRAGTLSSQPAAVQAIAAPTVVVREWAEMPYDPKKCDVLLSRTVPVQFNTDGRFCMFYHFWTEVVAPWWKLHRSDLERALAAGRVLPLVQGARQCFKDTLGVLGDTCPRAATDFPSDKVCWLPASASRAGSAVSAVKLPPALPIADAEWLWSHWSGSAQQLHRAAVNSAVLAPHSVPGALRQPPTNDAREALPAVPDKPAEHFQAVARTAALTRALTSPMITLLSRRNKRLLLNEKQLVNAARAAGHRIRIVALEELCIADQLAILATTSVLIGVHGSGLSNSVFLPRGSALVQLLPYGVQNGAQFFQSAATSAGVAYFEWKNPNISRTTQHWHYAGKDLAGSAGQAIHKSPPGSAAMYFSFSIQQDTWMPEDAWLAVIQHALSSPLNRQLQQL